MESKDEQGDQPVVEVLAESCRQCGKTIEVISPTWFTIHRDLRKLRMSYRYAPDDTALCVACCLASKSPDERPAWEHLLARLLRRKELAKVPASATLLHHRDKNMHVFDRTNAVHHTDIYFLVSRSEARPEWRVPAETFRPDDGSAPTVLIWVGVDVTLEGIPASVCVTWNFEHLGSGESMMQVVNWQHTTHDDLIRLMQGTRFLYETAGLWRGRPPGRTSLTREEFLEQYRQAREQCLREGRPPTDNNLLLYLPISKSTLVRYRNEWLPDNSITEK